MIAMLAVLPRMVGISPRPANLSEAASASVGWLGGSSMSLGTSGGVGGCRAACSPSGASTPASARMGEMEKSDSLGCTARAGLLSGCAAAPFFLLSAKNDMSTSAMVAYTRASGFCGCGGAPFSPTGDTENKGEPGLDEGEGLLLRGCAGRANSMASASSSSSVSGASSSVATGCSCSLSVAGVPSLHARRASQRWPSPRTTYPWPRHSRTTASRHAGTARSPTGRSLSMLADVAVSASRLHASASHAGSCKCRRVGTNGAHERTRAETTLSQAGLGGGSASPARSHDALASGKHSSTRACGREWEEKETAQFLMSTVACTSSTPLQCMKGRSGANRADATRVRAHCGSAVSCRLRMAWKMIFCRSTCISTCLPWQLMAMVWSTSSPTGWHLRACLDTRGTNPSLAASPPMSTCTRPTEKELFCKHMRRASPTSTDTWVSSNATHTRLLEGSGGAGEGGVASEGGGEGAGEASCSEKGCESTPPDSTHFCITTVSWAMSNS
mmetsp:Transcript_42229/g.106525  ORF Transcript_42229/g.106525 Transcript_42229/m.106525 type:complete len:501 (-) Transcript_42229:1094-2596(-)